MIGMSADGLSTAIFEGTAVVLRAAGIGGMSRPPGFVVGPMRNDCHASAVTAPTKADAARGKIRRRVANRRRQGKRN
jgi:hypothetical protein